MKTPLFEKYAMLIRKRAHQYSKEFGIDYSEMESQGFLIYCECLEEYDAEKSSFCTYLYIQLNKLRDYAKMYKRQQGTLIQEHYMTSKDDGNTNYEELIPSREVSPAVEDFMLEAKQELSENAYVLLTWIVSREWEGKNRRRPTMTMAIKHFKAKKENIAAWWEECKNFWNVSGSAFYA